MTTTVTRSLLLSKQPRFEVIEVEGLGSVGIREVSESKKWRRYYQMMDTKGEAKPEAMADWEHYKLIDQLMIDEDTPLFTDADIEQIRQMPASVLDPLHDAVNTFNGGPGGN
jgi:hypothetical protein